MLLRFDPFRPLDRTVGEGATRRDTRSLPMEVRRREDELVIRLDVPGVGADDVDVTVERDLLTVAVERSTDDEGELLVDERPTGRFERRLRLGERLDRDGLEAVQADGVLTIRIPVREEAAARRVPITAGAA